MKVGIGDLSPALPPELTLKVQRMRWGWVGKPQQERHGLLLGHPRPESSSGRTQQESEDLWPQKSIAACHDFPVSSSSFQPQPDQKYVAEAQSSFNIIPQGLGIPFHAISGV